MNYLNAFGVNNDFQLANEADNPHFASTLGVDKRICFIDLADKVRPSALHLHHFGPPGTAEMILT